jgi:hypothetical protein
MTPNARSRNPEPGPGGRARRARRALLAPLLGAGLASAPALAAGPILFHSPADDGQNPGCPLRTECVLGAASGDHPLNLWLDPGPEAGQGLCGDLCGVDAVIEVEGGSFRGFAAEPGVVQNPACQAGTGGPGEPPCLLPPGADRLILNASFAAQGARTGVRRLGRLTVATPPAPLAAAVSVNGVEIVDGALQPRALPIEIIAVPEPGRGLLLASGVLLLAALGRRRRCR